MKKIWMKYKSVFLIVAAVIMLISAIMAGYLWYEYRTLMNKLNYVEVPVKTEAAAVIETEATKATEAAVVPTEKPKDPYGKTGKIVNVLLIGQASREGESAKLSDTIMLCTINKETKTVTLTSFLRDTFVYLANNYTDSRGRYHDGGRQRINVAYALGYTWGGYADAMGYLDQTIQRNFGVEVDYNVEIDFDAFEEAIDLMGGIKVDLNEAEAKYVNDYFKGKDYDKTFTEGSNLLNGWEALVYARMRHSTYGDNDFNRTNRQRTVVTKLLEKCKKRSFFQLTKMAGDLLPYITTDMGEEDIRTLMLELIPMLPELKVETVQCPAPGTYSGVMVWLNDVECGVLKFDENKNREMLMAIAEAD